MILACITSLLTSRSPIAIGWLVVSIVVTALNAVVATGWIAHVSVEVLERQPSLTDRDTPFAVVVAAAVVGITASLKHTMPPIVNWSVRQPVSCGAFNEARELVAPAANDVPLPQVCASRNFLIAAFAFAEPVRTEFRSYISKSHDGQFPKWLAADVFDLSAATSRLNFSHDDTSNIRLVRTAMQHQLPSRLHFTIVCSSGAMCTCSLSRKGA